MIKFRLILFVLAASMLLFNSCEKIAGHATGASGSTTGGTTTGSGTLTFNVDGVAKTSALTVGVYSASLGFLQISGQVGSVSSTEGLSITIQNPAVGTFPITANNTLCIYTTTTANDSWFGATGSVIITSFTSDTVTGTFSFVAGTFSGTATKNITNGVFNVKYTKQ